MNDKSITEVVHRLEESLRGEELPIVTYLAETRYDPFLILISTLLSLRTKDEVTAEATDRLFALAGTPADMLALPEADIARCHLPGRVLPQQGPNHP